MKIKVGVVGLGYWGPNYVRNFLRQEQTEVVWGCDLQDSSIKTSKKLYPQLKFTKNYSDLLSDKSLNCVAIATPPDTHYKLAKAALEAGKHVLIAKPLTTKSKTAKELIKLAKKRGLLLHCDLTYLYSGGVKALKNILQTGVIGKPLYFDSIRTNLGLIQNEVNVIWDLAIHDLAITDFLFGLTPKKIFAVGSKHHKNSATEEMAHITINYSKNFIAHIHVSWLSPVKMRTILVGGDKKMVLFDDVEPDEKVKLYDKGVVLSQESITPFKPLYRSGDVLIPKIDGEEPLFRELEQVIQKILRNKVDYENPQLNLRIITLLEACDKSLRENKPIALNTHTP